MIKRLINLLKREVIGIPGILKCLYYGNKKNSPYVILFAWCFFKKKELIKNNLGDDLNIFLAEKISGKKILVYPNTRLGNLFCVKRYMFIGSILHFKLKNAIVCGAGIRNSNNTSLNGIPTQITAVRGPLTKQILEDHGVKCAPVYGDPALLLPRFYTPNKIKNKKIGVIPHYNDLESKYLDLFKNDDCRIIKMRDYNSWTEVIDEINSCDVIFSSSLHGLIISEAYSIPYLWVQFLEKEDGWDFKYHDFFLSVGKDYPKPFDLADCTDVFVLAEKTKKNWKKGYLDLDILLSAIPFRRL